MVFVEHVDDPKSALWIDGYLPSKGWLAEKYESLHGRVANESHSTYVRQCSLDNMFLKILEHATYRQVTNRSNSPAVWDDLYLLGAVATQGTLAHRLPWIERQIAAESGNRYGAIIAVYSYTGDQQPLQNSERVMRDCAFRVKDVKSTYENWNSFRRDVDKLLNLVIEPFITPCTASAERLKSLGFRTGHLVL